MKKIIILLVVFGIVLVGGVIQYYDSILQEKTVHNLVTPDIAKMQRDAHNAIQSETIEDWIQNLNEVDSCFYRPFLRHELNMEFLCCTNKETPCSYEHIKYIEGWMEELKTEQ